MYGVYISHLVRYARTLRLKLKKIVLALNLLQHHHLCLFKEIENRIKLFVMYYEIHFTLKHLRVISLYLVQLNAIEY